MSTKYKIHIITNKIIYSISFSFISGVLLTFVWKIIEFKLYNEVQIRRVDDIILILFMAMSFFAGWNYLSNKYLHNMLESYPIVRSSYLDEDDYMENDDLKRQNKILKTKVSYLEQECIRLENILREMDNEKAENKEQV